MKIWAKTLFEDKITKDCIYEISGKPSKALLEQAMREICEQMDIPCPLILKSHALHFLSFNVTKFMARDFVESINFDNLILENIPEK